ncbi:MAG: hypothetical protein AAFQ58_15395 [Pseudomonadota bacterium]
MAKRKRPEKGPQDDQPSDTPEIDTEQSDKVDLSVDAAEDLGTDLSKDVMTTDVIEGEAEEVDIAEAEATAEPEAEILEAERETEAEVEIGEQEFETLEPDPEPQSEPVPAAPPPPPQPESERPSVLPLVFAGIITALFGFIAGRSEILDPIFPPRSTTVGADAELVEQLNNTVVDLTAQLDETNARVAALNSDIEALPEALPTAAPAETVDLGPLEQQVETLASRIDAISGQPAVVPDAAIDAALADLRATATAQQDEIDRLLADARLARENAEASASATLARAAVSRVLAAVDNGAPFAAALGDLEAAGVTDIPEPLRATATDGVAPLATLQANIPDAARASLAAARSAEGGGGLGAFFERQLGTRSILPREGSDPDAVLSRVEAAARDGRLGDALAEADALPDAAREALAPWLERAQQRHQAVTAANALAQRLSAL